MLLQANERAHKEVLERLARAMDFIRSDVAMRTKADGSPIRVSAAEVCRRAGVHAKTLNNRNYCETTRRMVREFLKEVNSTNGSRKRVTKRRVDEKNAIIANWEASIVEWRTTMISVCLRGTNSRDVSSNLRSRAQNSSVGTRSLKTVSEVSTLHRLNKKS